MTYIDDSDELEGIVETTQPGGGLLMRTRGTKEAYLWAGPGGTIDVQRVR